MKRPNIRGRGPEAIIQEDIIKMLESRGWFVQQTHGNLYSSGLPDLYCGHPIHKQRWVEVKNLKRYKFTNAQLEKFPLISEFTGIWIMTAATDDEYGKLFGHPNWRSFLK